MKFMKLGTRPDIFYTDESIRTVNSDVATDLVIQIKNSQYLLHKYPLLPKCGLLQSVCHDTDDKKSVAIELHDIPGGADAFEQCAKFCYGITISLGAHNIVPAFCAAKFLHMTENIEKGNLLSKLESFFLTCILEGWKDSIGALQTTLKLSEWSENVGITRRCIDSIVDKILTPPSKVTWSYTYTRPGYIRAQHQSAPKDWWTEDISNLDIELFRYIITAVKSINMLPSQLIGEALHVYVCRWLPDTTHNRHPEAATSQTNHSLDKNRRVLEIISSLIPAERGSVSIGFLLRLVSLANCFCVSKVTRDHLVRRSSLQLEDATLNDVLSHDIDLVGAVLDFFLVIWKRKIYGQVENNNPFMISIRKVGKLVDCYLQAAAKNVNMRVSDIVSLAEALPEVARPMHDDLYKAINIYMKVHPDLTKTDKKRLCRILDCQKLSKEVRAHAVKNERLPLRTVVQVLFFDQESSSSTRSGKQSPQAALGQSSSASIGDDLSRFHLGNCEIEEIEEVNQKSSVHVLGRNKSRDK